MKNHIALYLLLIVCGSVSRAVDPVVENPSTEDIVVLECTEIDKVVADFPVGFSYLVDDGWHYAGYYNEDRQLTVAARDPKTGIWTHNALPERVGWDSHNSIVMATDSAGCLHVSGNMHAVPMIYYRTQTAGDIQTLKKHYPMVDEARERRCTYPRFMKNKSGQLIFHYRHGGSGQGDEYFNYYDEATGRWQSLLQTPLFDGESLKSAYRLGPGLGPDGNYHVAWVWRETPDCQTNHELSYVVSPDLKTWRTVAGKPLELPLKAGCPELIVDPVPVKGGIINGGFRLALDHANHPCIAYHKYDADGFSQVYIAMWKNSQWMIRQVSNWSYRWGFSGTGSQNSEIRIRGLKRLDKGRMEISYWHIKYGSGTFVVSTETGALIEEEPVAISKKAKRYPDRLQKPISNTEGLAVCWSSLIQDADDPSVSYALRWEANPVRNSRNLPPKSSFPPSSLMWYKFKNMSSSQK